MVAFESAIISARDEIDSFVDAREIENCKVFILWQHIGWITVPQGFDYRPIVKKAYDDIRGLSVDQNGEVRTFTEVWSLFEDVVQNRRVKYFKSAFSLAKLRASKRQTPLPESVENEYDPPYQSLLAVCYELQNITGENPFFITGQQAGSILGRTQPVGDMALKMFMRAGILERVSTGHTGVASEYFYKGQRAE